MTPDEAKAHIDTYERQPGIDLVALIDRADMEDALETVAGMKYEYAVQVMSEKGWWVHLDSCGRQVYFPVMGQRYEKELRARIAAVPYGPCRIVRRLVGDIEVCE